LYIVVIEMKSFDDILKERSKIAKTNICYFNAKNEIVQKENATSFVIAEYDADGNVVNTIWGAIEK